MIGWATHDYRKIIDMTYTPEFDKLKEYATPHISAFLKGHPAACDFAISFMLIVHAFDDLVDKDVTLTNDELYETLWRVLIDLPLNSFYRENFQVLHPLVVNTLMNWRTANQLEATRSLTDKEISYVLRSSYVDILTACALIVGGREWVVKVGADIRRWEHCEGFENYVKEFTL